MHSASARLGETDEPPLTIALHHFMARILAERLAAIHRTLQSVMQ